MRLVKPICPLKEGKSVASVVDESNTATEGKTTASIIFNPTLAWHSTAISAAVGHSTSKPIPSLSKTTIELQINGVLLHALIDRGSSDNYMHPNAVEKSSGLH